MGRTLNAEPTVRRNGDNGAHFVQVTLRLPPALHGAAKQSAKESGRSLNAEILHKLAEGLGCDALEAAPESHGLMQQIADDLKAIRERICA